MRKNISFKRAIRKLPLIHTQVLDDLIANEIIRQFAQREGLALNEAEIESIRQAQEETYCMMEEAFKTGSETSKNMPNWLWKTYRKWRMFME